MSNHFHTSCLYSGCEIAGCEQCHDGGRGEGGETGGRGGGGLVFFLHTSQWGKKYEVSHVFVPLNGVGVSYANSFVTLQKQI